jgi:hypothetical protein
LQVLLKDVNVEKVEKGKNGYHIATVDYEYKGESKQQKIFSFVNPGVFKAIQELPKGAIEVELTKNSKGYSEWAKVSVASEGSSEPQKTRIAGSNYETPEERAKRQLLIVRQSSLTNALTFLNGKDAAVEEVEALAQRFVDFVYQNDQAVLEADSKH